MPPSASPCSSLVIAVMSGLIWTNAVSLDRKEREQRRADRGAAPGARRSG
jgi:hypothetical protein